MTPIRWPSTAPATATPTGSSRRFEANATSSWRASSSPIGAAGGARPARTPYHGVRWFDHAGGVLDDPTIVAVASEGRNDESLAQTAAIVRAGKHVWYDKPAGDDWRDGGRSSPRPGADLAIQMGYMFRYHEGFSQIAGWRGPACWARSSPSARTCRPSIPISPPGRSSPPSGGIFYDLAGHMLDQIVWLLGRPAGGDRLPPAGRGSCAGLQRQHAWRSLLPRGARDVDIAAMEPPPTARRFEVYGSRAARSWNRSSRRVAIRLCLIKDVGERKAGEQTISRFASNRDRISYDAELVEFVAMLRGQQPPERSFEHDLLVQETLLRLTGGIVA